MSRRLYTRNSQGRQPLLGPAPRFSKNKEHPNDTYQEPNNRRRKRGGKYATISKTSSRRPSTASATSGHSTTAESQTADESSDDEDQSDASDEPELVAPSRQKRKRATGRTRVEQLEEQATDADTEDSMFGDFENYYKTTEDPDLSPDENRKQFEHKVFVESDEENDDFYKAVDDISDSESESVQELAEQELLALLNENAETEYFLNQIEGMSAYGFGDESDGSGQFPPSSHGSDAAGDSNGKRHVRFDVEADVPAMYRFSESPTMSRALLPSAMPDIPFQTVSAQGLGERQRGTLMEDPDDSDLTDDCLPEEAQRKSPNGLSHSLQDVEQDDDDTPPPPSSPSKQSAKKTARRKGPPRGIFIDEGDKASGILDSTGKIILMTNPHLLGEDFARRYGASQTSSPDLGFEELIDESDAGGTPRQASGDVYGASGADIMLASLNSTFNDPANHGHLSGPLEAFYPASGFDLGDYAFDPDDVGGVFQPDPELGEDVINLEDVIQFDEDSNDDSDAPTSPFFMPPSDELSGIGNVNNHFAHLNNNNVTAFRRNADPNFASISSTPNFYQHEAFSTPPMRRKRKAHESPYHSSHYKGVTPVQRMRDPNHPHTPESAGPSSKRRRVMT